VRISFIPTSFWDVLSRVCQNLVQTTFNQNDEIKVWQKTDRFGNSYWSVYDPKSGHSAHFGTEQEVMSWIETHYYF